jgi:hypothetical protein
VTLSGSPRIVWPLKMEEQISCETLGIAHPMTLRHIKEDLDP